MTARREVMKVTVSWFTSDDDETVEFAMRYLDEHGLSPVDWVSQGLHAGAKSIDIDAGSSGYSGRGFEILVEGPTEWRASHDTPSRGNANGSEGDLRLGRGRADDRDEDGDPASGLG